MRVLFLGLLYNRDDEKKLLTKTKWGLQGSVNTFQWNLIDGLDEVLNKPVTVVNSQPVGVYPKYYKQAFFSSKEWSHKLRAQDMEIGFINIPVFKELSRLKNAYSIIKNIYNKDPSSDLFIISYSLYLPYMIAILKICKKYNNIRSCIIVPDLPNEYGFMSYGNVIRKMLKKIAGKYELRIAKKYESFIVLADKMKEPLGIRNKPYIVIEGIANTRDLKKNNEFISNDEFIILYTGSLNKVFGIDKLIEAFLEVPYENYRLWLCGVGDYKNDIEKVAVKDKRIKYFGYLSREQVLDLQQQATLLINPRSNEGNYTKYSFPSKTIEYLMSGKPVLMFKLDGVPDEYDKYIFYIKENSVNGIKSAILDISEMPITELRRRGSIGQAFITNNKNGIVQAKRIVILLKKVQEKE